MKKLALISSHCNTEDKKLILQSNLKILKDMNIDTLVISNLKLSVDSDYLFITKENPILSWPERSITSWKILDNGNHKIKLVSSIDDYGWASLYQLKKLMEIGHTFEYDIFYVMLYDLEIDEIIKDDILSDKINLIYPRKDFSTTKIYPSSPHFMIFDKKKLKVMSDLIDKHAYLKINDGFAEDFIHQCVTLLGIQHSDHIVKDLIQCVNPNEVFNYSDSENYKFFFNKNDENFALLVYDFDKIIEVIINDDHFIINPNFQLIQTNIPCNKIEKILISSENAVKNYTGIFNQKCRSNIELI